MNTGNCSKTFYVLGETVFVTYDVTDYVRSRGGSLNGLQIGIETGSGKWPFGPIHQLTAAAGTIVFDEYVPEGTFEVSLVDNVFRRETLCSVTVGEPVGWVPSAAGSFTSVAVCPNGVVAIEATTRAAKCNCGMGWNDTGQTLSAIAGGEFGVFGIGVAPDDDKLYRLTDDSKSWDQVFKSAGLRNLCVSDEAALVVDGDGYIWLSTSLQPAWTFIGACGPQAVLNSSRVLVLAGDNTTITGSLIFAPGQWVPVVSTQQVSKLYLAGNSLYALEADGQTLVRWDASDLNSPWVEVGGSGSVISAARAYLVRASDDATSVYLGRPGRWLKLGGPAQDICIDSAGLVWGLVNGQVCHCDLPNANDPSWGTAAPTSVSTGDKGLTADDVRSDPIIEDEWVVTIATSNAWGAGYDGDVSLRTLSGDTVYKLPISSFRRGRTYTFGFKTKTFDPTADGGFAVATAWNWLGDLWNVASIQLWSVTHRTLYTVASVGDVKHWPLQSNLYPIVLPLPSTPSGLATVHIWSFRGVMQAWGHASITLSSGEHISWWPTLAMGIDKDTIKLGFSSTGQALQDLAADEWAEAVNGHPTRPDVQLFVGGIDDAAVLTWWAGYKLQEPAPSWVAYDMNCSKAVYMALLKGGALSNLSNRTSHEYASTMFWTPSVVYKLIADVQATGR